MIVCFRLSKTLLLVSKISSKYSFTFGDPPPPSNLFSLVCCLVGLSSILCFFYFFLCIFHFILYLYLYFFHTDFKDSLQNNDDINDFVNDVDAEQI